MAKFSYRMQNILDVKQKQETQAKSAFAIARIRMNEEEEKLENLFAKKKALEDELRSISVGDIDVKELVFYNNSIEYTKNTIKRQLVEVKVASKNLEAANKRLSEIMKDRKIHEKLKEKAFEDFLVELNEQEKKEIDELVSFRFDGGDQQPQ